MARKAKKKDTRSNAPSGAARTDEQENTPVRGAATRKKKESIKRDSSVPRTRATPRPSKKTRSNAPRDVKDKNEAGSFSVVALGTRQDAAYWADTAATEIQLTEGSRVLGAFPTLNSISTLFGRSDDWLYLAGHFTSANHLHNDAALNGDPNPISVHFYGDRIVVDRAGTSRTLRKGTEFRQHQNLKVLFWGGCNVHTDTALVRTLRALFGNVTMIGWLGVTGWQIVHTVLGGYGTGGPYPDRDFFERAMGDPMDSSTVTSAWLEAAIAATFGNPSDGGAAYDRRFSVIRPNGQEYVIRDNAVSLGRQF